METEPEAEEEDLLLEDPIPASVREDKTLLAFRQEYKKVSTCITRANSHLNFIQQCEERENVPKGLRVNVKCNALLTEYTQVKEKFMATKTMAEKDFASHLKEHYSKVLEKLETELKQVQEKMTMKMEQVGDEEKKNHLELMDKTKENIIKHRDRLVELKKKKLEHLSSNQGTRETRQFQRTGRRTTPYTNQPRQYGPTRPVVSRPTRQGNYLNKNSNSTRAQQEPIQQQTYSPDLSKEVVEMRAMLNQLLLKQAQPQPRELIPQTQARELIPQPQIPINYCPPAQQHPSLLPMPVGPAATGQPPLLDSRQPQYFRR